MIVIVRSSSRLVAMLRPLSALQSRCSCRRRYRAWASFSCPRLKDQSACRRGRPERSQPRAAAFRWQPRALREHARQYRPGEAPSSGQGPSGARTGTTPGSPGELWQPARGLTRRGTGSRRRPQQRRLGLGVQRGERCEHDLAACDVPGRQGPAVRHRKRAEQPVDRDDPPVRADDGRRTVRDDRRLPRDAPLSQRPA